MRSARVGEGGYTLVETMLAAALGLVLLGAIFVVSNLVTRSEPTIRGRSDQVQLGRALIERVDRELRQSERIDTYSASGMTLWTYVRHSTCGGGAQASSTTAAIVCKVTYACAGGVCTRAETGTGSSGTGTPYPVVSGLTTSTPFTYTGTPPYYVGISFVLAGTNGGHAITLSDGVNVRNVTSD